MYEVVRNNVGENALILISGQKQYNYDADSLVQLDSENDLTNIVFGAHPYMGSPQAGVPGKSAQGFSDLVDSLYAGSERPLFITEFGQGDCGGLYSRAYVISAEANTD